MYVYFRLFRCLNTKFVLMKIIVRFALFGAMLSVFACVNNKQADLPTDPAACDTVSLSYSKHIAPLIAANNCLNCHSAQTATAGIILDNYADVSSNAETVYPTIAWGPSLPAGKKMPVGGPQVSDCQLTQFEAWIKQGKKP